jgi:hypothetical protein
MKTIANIILFAVVSFILLLPFYNIWGVPTENGTNSGNNSKRDGLNYSNNENLTGVLPTTYPEVSMKGLVVTSPNSNSKSFPLVIDIFPDKNDYTYFEDIQIYYKVDGNKLEPVKLIFED